MSKKDILKILKDIKIQGRGYSKGISLIRSYIKKQEADDDLRYELAWLLYHKAFTVLEGTKSEKRELKVKKDLKEAAEIFEQIIKTTKKHKNIYINSRIGLAQLYTKLNKNKSVKLAEENYRSFKNPLTINRLIDVYIRVGENKKVENLIKNYVKLSEKENTPKFYIYGDLVIWYKKLGKKNLAKHYYELTLKNIPQTKEGRSFKKILNRNFY